MVSREHKRSAALHEQLQLLRSITHSNAVNDTSIIVDASKYIEELKEKVESLNEDISSTSSTAQSSSANASIFPEVRVETLERGFEVNVYSGRSCPGLLVSVLEAFEELNLTVLEASVSCEDTFQFQAFSGHNEQEQGEVIDGETVRQAVMQAIQHWSHSGDHQH